LAMTVIGSHAVQDEQSMAAHREWLCLVCEDVKKKLLTFIAKVIRSVL